MHQGFTASPRLRVTLSLIVTLSVSGLLPAQQAGTGSTPATEEVVELSPFAVNTSRDIGYQAENTLAGSRLNTKLRDTPASVSVFTKEFLDDLGITDIKQLVEYTVNSEMDTASRVAGTAQNSFINAQNLNGNILTRGISASQGLDYFMSIAPGDAYRVGRYDDSRGPNSVLFGVGAVGGVINQSSKVAVTHADSAMLRYGIGSFDRHRFELDANKVLRKDKLALSLAGLYQANGGWRQFDFQDKKRMFGSLTFRPLPRLTFQVMGETGRDISAVMRTTSESEEVLAWYDNRNARGADAVTFTPTTAAPTAAQIALGVITRNSTSGGTNRRVTYIENNATIFDAAGTFLTGTYNNSSVRAPDGTPGRTGATLRINDPSWYSYDNNAAGPGMNRTQSLSNYTITADWQPTKNLFVNVGHNYQKTNALINLMVGASPVLRGDPNRTLGVGGPVNPYAGRLYFDGDWRRDIHFRDYEESRLSASYDLDPKWKWMGRHRVVGLVSHSEDYDERANSWLVLAGRPFNADPLNPNNRVTVRNYLTEGDQRTYRVGDWRILPKTINFGGRAFETAYANDALTQGTNGGAIQKTNALLGVVQSHFLHDRLVTTFGYRQDRVKIIELGYRNDPIQGDVVDPDPAKQTSNDFIGKTHTAGVVLHVFDWLSVIANRSTNVGVPSFNRTVFPTGDLAPAPQGKGADYGLGFDFLHGRLTAKVAYFESNEEGATGAYGASASFTQRNQRVMEAFGSVLVGAGRPFSQSQWDPLLRSYTPGVSGSLTDFNSSGYEARVTANLKTNWRLVLNYSYNDSGRAQLFKDALPWYGMKQEDGVLVKQGVSQNAAGQFVVDPSAYEAGGAVAKWIELGRMSAAANPSTLTTSANVTVAREIFNLVDEVNDMKAEQEKRWGLRPHKISMFTAYDFKEGWLKSFSVGGGWRWRSANIIGTDANGREVTGRSLQFADIMLRYARKFQGLPGRVSFQVNVNNLFDNDKIIPQRLLRADDYEIPGGRGRGYGRYDLVEPRDIRFTTTYSF
jgi:outer membrane receptor for ferric coprogen and ferric-rhodotorulic acid